MTDGLERLTENYVFTMTSLMEVCKLTGNWDSD